MEYIDIGTTTSGSCTNSASALEIYEGYEPTSNLVDMHCGRKSATYTYTYRISTERVMVKFRTDGTGGQGFVFTYKMDTRSPCR